MGWIQSKIPDLPITNFTSDWNDGRAVGALVDAVAPGTVIASHPVFIPLTEIGVSQLELLRILYIIVTFTYNRFVSRLERLGPQGRPAKRNRSHDSCRRLAPHSSGIHLAFAICISFFFCRLTCICLVQLVKPEEMINPNVDELSMMTYLSQYPNAKLQPNAPLRPKANPNRYSTTCAVCITLLST